MNEEQDGSEARRRNPLRSASERVRGSIDRVTGTEFRRQFDEFTDAVTAVIVGLDADVRARLPHQFTTTGGTAAISSSLMACQM